MQTAGSPQRATPLRTVDLVEPEVRRLVAETLGVEAGELTPEVSLTDDLAADSLDLVELGVTLESELGVTLSESTLDGVRSYGDVVAAVRTALLRDGWWTLPTPFRAGVTAANGGAGRLERSGVLTPYEKQLLAGDVERLGPGSRLDVELAADAPANALADVREQFAPLAARGVEVRVHRRGH
jgi:acyl carrier protein